MNIADNINWVPIYSVYKINTIEQRANVLINLSKNITSKVKITIFFILSVFYAKLSITIDNTMAYDININYLLGEKLTEIETILQSNTSLLNQFFTSFANIIKTITISNEVLFIILSFTLLLIAKLITNNRALQFIIITLASIISYLTINYDIILKITPTTFDRDSNTVTRYAIITTSKWIYIDARNTNFTNIDKSNHTTQQYNYNIYDYYDIGDIINTKTKETNHSKFLEYILKRRNEISEYYFTRSNGSITLFQAEIFGNREYIDYGLTDEFRITGLTHILAQSGLHIGLIVLLLVFTLRQSTKLFAKIIIFINKGFSKNKQTRNNFLSNNLIYTITLSMLPIFFILSGFSNTVLRAIIFVTLYAVGRYFFYNINSIKFVIFIAGLLLILAPYNVYSVGFYLSFGAVLGIILFYNSLKIEEFEKSKQNNLQNLLKPKKKYAKYLGWLINSANVGVAATIITTPIILYYFGIANLASIITTIIIVPLITIEIMLGIVALFTPTLVYTPTYYTEYALVHTVHYLYLATKELIIFVKLNGTITLIMLIISLVLLYQRKLYIKYLPLLMFIPLIVMPEKISSIINPYSLYNQTANFYTLNMYSSKGYIYTGEQGSKNSEIYYKGTYQNFIYDFLPLTTSLGKNEFTKGKIEIINDKNNKKNGEYNDYNQKSYINFANYINLKNKENNATICVNSNITSNINCKLIFATRSNSITKKEVQVLNNLTLLSSATDNSSSVHYKAPKIIIYKNKYEHENIITYDDEIYSKTPLIMHYNSTSNQFEKVL